MRVARKSRRARFELESLDSRCLLSPVVEPQPFQPTAISLTLNARTVPPDPYPVNHPQAANNSYYGLYPGTLYGPSGKPLYTDVHQGAIGDCWLMASLADAAARDPQLITQMFTPLGAYIEGGVQVQLWRVEFNNNPRDTIIVDNEFPTYQTGPAANHPIYDQIYVSVLWVALAEKAYVEAAGMGYVQANNQGLVGDTYSAVDGGQPAWALEAITGKHAYCYTTNTSAITSVTSAGNNAADLVVLATGAKTTSTSLVPDHCYAVINDTGPSQYPFTVYNPWGEGAYTTWTNPSDKRAYTVFGATFYCNTAFVAQNFGWYICS